MPSLLQSVLLALTLVPCVTAQEPVPQALPPIPILEAKLETAQSNLRVAEREWRDIDQSIDDLDDDIADAAESINGLESKIEDYQDLLAQHESNLSDPYLHPAQREQLMRAMRATRAHLAKLGNVLRSLQQDRARDLQERTQFERKRLEVLGQIRELRATVGMIKTDLAAASKQG